MMNENTQWSNANDHINSATKKHCKSPHITTFFKTPTQPMMILIQKYWRYQFICQDHNCISATH